MFTKLTQAVLAKNGEKLRSALLVPQAVYTLGLANSEGAPLVQLLPANCLIEVAGVCEQVDKARQDKAIAAVEAKLATGSERALVRDLKVWWRQAASHVELSQLAGAEVPAEVIQVRRSQALSALLEETSKTLGLLDKHKGVLDIGGTTTQVLIDEGRKLYQALLQAEGAQEQARATDLPAAVQAFNVAKGELYIGLKMINAAGHRVHAHDPQSSARFNLSILNRRHSPAAPAPVPAPGPTPVSPK
jgi:hypothetical protein